MGTWFATFLKKNGYRVNVYDKNTRAAKNLSRRKKLHFVENLNRATTDAQLIIFATPTSVTKQLLQRIQVNGPSKSIVEISSVKTPIKSTILKLQKKGVPILSIHPMFGGGAKSIADRVILTTMIPTDNQIAKKFLLLLKKNGAKLIQCSLKDHDKLAAIILALPHFINIVFINSLKALAVNLDHIRTVAGTTFKLQLLIAEAIYQEGKENELSILVDNAHSLNTLKKLAHETASLLGTIEDHRSVALERTLASGHKFISKEKEFASSYVRFNDAVEVSYRR